MAAIDDLIAQISDDDLRQRIAVEVGRLIKNKKFGLVFEDHLPEDVTDAPIYPYLQRLGEVRHGRDDDPWHTLIEADNYYALRLLAYVYPGKVDCIYIDPPYNTGARDWKYNNDYVDASDRYRHSKWLSMMKRRLLLAKKLLNPNDSVLICTIDEKEYLHLGCLLEELFPEARMQMVSSVINPKGNRRDNEFSRCEEYIFFIYFGQCHLITNGYNMLRDDDEEKSKGKSSKDEVRLRALLRGASNHGRRKDRPNLFYPLLFDEKNGKFIGHGPVLSVNDTKEEYKAPAGTKAMFPIGKNGEELTWNLQPETLMDKWQKHFLSFSKWDGEKRTCYYLSAGQEKSFGKGEYEIKGFDDDGAYIISHSKESKTSVRPLTIWHKKSHSASDYGTTLLNGIIGSGRFSFPKSLYAVHDAIRFFVANKPDALILDFFAGSGTTLHAVNLLNAEDGGHRRCVMVTNNEVSDQEAKTLTKQGLKRGDEAWERLGIARYVCWPRTVCSIEGHDINGHPLKGEYIGDRHLQMKDGFAANAVFFKLGFLNKNAVALGRQFRELLPMLWMKAGSRGPVPTVEGDEVPPMLVLPQNAMAILTDEKSFDAFAAQVNSNPDIKTVYLVVDGDATYRAMAQSFAGRKTCQLYRDYLDNFRINPSTL